MPSRQLLCPPCAANMKRISERPDIVAEGESVRFVFGTSRGDYVCDDCNADLGPGKRCAATTLYARGQAQLGPWEPDYVVPEEPAHA